MKKWASRQIFLTLGGYRLACQASANEMKDLHTDSSGILKMM